MINETEGRRILSEASHGVLSMVTPEGEAYGVFVNHVYLPQENCLFFHCAKKGKKIDCLSQNPKVCFTACVNAELVPECFATHYESVIVSGSASFVEDLKEKERYLLALCSRFSPGEARTQEVILRSIGRVEICKITISSLTAKRNEDS